MALKKIVIRGNVFNPTTTFPNGGEKFVVEVGDSVAWDNQDNVEHNVMSLGTPAFSLDDFGHGLTKSVGPFTAATDQNGVEYTCTLHADMNGWIVVVLPGSHPEAFTRVGRKPGSHGSHGTGKS